MTRIKSDNVQMAGSFVVPIEQSVQNKKMQEALEKEKEIIVQAEAQAQEILLNAKQRAQELVDSAIEEANSKREEISKQAHQEGFEAGREEGFANITIELSDKVIAVDTFAKSMFEVKNNIIKSSYNDIISLVTEIAHKICGEAFKLEDNVLKEITLQAIKSLKDKESITIIVNPELAEKIYSVSDELKEKIPQLASIKIIEDTSVSPDGTIVESPLSRVDSRVSSQIGEISQKLFSKLDSTSNSDLADSIDLEKGIEEFPNSDEIGESNL